MGLLAGVVNGILTVAFGFPAFVATLGMFYIARGLASWLVAGQQLTGFTESYNLIGRKLGDILNYLQSPAAERACSAPSPRWSACRPLWMLLVSIIAGTVLGFMPFGQNLYATGGNIRAAAYAGINTNRSASSHSSSARSARHGRLINIAYFRSFNPVAGQFRELDGIAAVIIGGGSIFGGYGTIIGALAGAAVITLVRALLQLNVGGLRHAAALDQRLHRRDPDRRRADRHLGPPAEHHRRLRADSASATENQTGSRQCLTRAPHRSSRCAASQVLRRGRALPEVNLVLYPGEILGLVGDNSAGKSTLMKILTGAYQRDTGEILVAGKPVHFRTRTRAATSASR